MGGLGLLNQTRETTDVGVSKFLNLSFRVSLFFCRGLGRPHRTVYLAGLATREVGSVRGSPGLKRE